MQLKIQMWSSPRKSLLIISKCALVSIYIVHVIYVIIKHIIHQNISSFNFRKFSDTEISRTLRGIYVFNMQRQNGKRANPGGLNGEPYFLLQEHVFCFHALRRVLLII